MHEGYVLLELSPELNISTALGVWQGLSWLLNYQAIDRHCPSNKSLVAKLSQKLKSEDNSAPPLRNYFLPFPELSKLKSNDQSESQAFGFTFSVGDIFFIGDMPPPAERGRRVCVEGDDVDEAMALSARCFLPVSTVERNEGRPSWTPEEIFSYFFYKVDTLDLRILQI